jgi:hydroxymethylglutaryl-CoA lyase
VIQDAPLVVFHNTRNTGYANAIAAVERGAAALDASAGGIGGCPFAPPPRATSPPRATRSGHDRLRISWSWLGDDASR